MESNKVVRVALYLPLGKRNAQWSGLGGAEKRLCYLISHMDKSLFYVSIVFRVYCDEKKILYTLNKYISGDCHIVFTKNDLEAFNHFKREKYDYVLYDDCMVLALPGVLGAILGHSNRILIFVTEYYARWAFKKKWHALIMRLNGILATSIDCLYPSSKRILEKKFKRKNITITPCSLPLIDDYVNVENKTNIIVFAGRLVPEKNPILLVEAARLAKNELEKNKYLIQICGAGPLEEKIIELINDYNLTDVVKYIGQQNMRNILSKALVFCSLQDNENYPSQSLLEAIVSGCICVATDNGDTKKIVKPEFGFLVRKDALELSELLKYIMNLSYVKKQNATQAAMKFGLKEFQPFLAINHYEELCSNKGNKK